MTLRREAARFLARYPTSSLRERIERCRRLASYVNDPRTTEALLQMADEGEADLTRLLAEREGRKPNG